MKKRSSVLLSICLLFALVSVGQRKIWNRDSLRKIINNSALHDTTRARAISRFAEYYKPTDSMINALAVADSITRRYNNYALTGRIMDMRVYLLYTAGDAKRLATFKAATDMLFFAQQHHDTLDIANAYFHRGQVYATYDMLDKAAAEEMKAAELFPHDKFKYGCDYTFYLVGYYMFNNHQYKEALPYFIRSYHMAIKDSLDFFLPEVSGWIGNTYSGLKMFDSAIYYRYVSLRYDKGDPSLLCEGYRYLGNVYQSLGNYDSSLILYHKSLDCFTKLKSVDRTWLIRYFIANVNYKKNNYAEAAKEVDEILDTATGKKGFLVKYLTIQLAGKVYDKAGQKDKAIAAYQKLVQLNDSVQKSDKADNVNEMNSKMQFEQAQQMQQIEQEHKNELAQKDKQRQAIIRNVLIAGFIGLLFFAVIMYRNFQQKKKDNILLAKQKDEIGVQKKEIQDSINYARNIQHAILPDINDMQSAVAGLFVLYKPKDVVSGDFYWHANVNGKSLIAAVDCTGHGVPGAFMSMIGNDKLNNIVRKDGETSPGKILGHLNRQVKEALHQNINKDTALRDGMDLALLAISYQPMAISFSGANRPLYIVRNGILEEVKPTKTSIGGYTDDDMQFEEHTLQLSKGDIIYLASDGYADQFGGGKSKKFTTRQFKETLLAIAKEPIQKQKQMLEDILAQWQGNEEQIDDILVIGIQV